MVIKMKIEEAYEIMQAASGLTVPGTKVKILRKATDGEMGWANGWASFMDETIGKTGEVVYQVGRAIKVSVDGDRWNYPFFVLEKVADPTVKIRVGDCLTYEVSREKAKAIIGLLE